MKQDKRGKQFKCRECDSLIRVSDEPDTVDSPDTSECGVDDSEPLPSLPSVPRREKTLKPATSPENAAGPEAIRRNLLIFLGVAGVVLIAGVACLIAWSAALGTMLVTAAISSATTGVTIAMEQYKLRMIRDDIERYGGTVKRISNADFWWLPGPVSSVLRSARRHGQAGVYRVAFTDRNGDTQVHYCRVDLVSGPAWGNDPYRASMSNEWSRGDALMIVACVGILFLAFLTAYAMPVEAYYAFRGQTATAEVTRTEWMQTRAISHNRRSHASSTKRYYLVKHTFQDGDGEMREEACHVTSPLFTG